MDAPDSGRRLAAVWFADIAGYTALSNRDEDTAVRIVGSLQRLAQAAASAHGGRVVKFIGDAVLTEFPSTDGALRSALDVQTAFEALDDVKASEVALRVGLHVGEVVGADDGDIYGDGVNLASRLESAAAPGRIFISEAVRTQIRQRPVFEVRSVGRRMLKGLPRPIEVFEAAYEGRLKEPLPPPKDRQPQPYWPRSRAIAMGLTVALVSFGALIAWNAFSNQQPAALRVAYDFQQLTFSGTAGQPRFAPENEGLAILAEADAFGGDLELCSLPEASGRSECTSVAAGVSTFAWAGAGEFVWSRSGTVYAGGGDEDRARIGSGWKAFSVDATTGEATRLEHARSGTRVVRQRLDGSGVDTVLAVPPRTRLWEAEWSPGGRWLLATFTDTLGEASLKLFPAAGGEPTTLFPERVSNPRWAPDAGAVYFLRDVAGTPGLHVLPVDGRGTPIGAPQPLMSGRNVESFDIAADGSIAFSEISRRANLYSFALREGAEPLAETQGTAPASGPALSPRGERFAFVRNGEVWVDDSTGTHQLTELDAPISALRWSPDGDLLAFIVQQASQRELHVIDASPESDVESRRIPLDHPLPYDLDPELTWAEGSDAVVYVAADPAGWPSVLSRVDTRTERDEVLVPEEPSAAANFQGLVSSPDGERVVLSDGVGGLRFVSVDDGTTDDVWPDTPGRPIHWSDDGQIVLRSLLDRRELRTMRAGEEKTNFLVRLPEGCDELAVSLAAGRAVCAITERTERDVWIARPVAR